jgi:G:T-mismatch repair DNA endonuclease (very short patch repair protein)
MNAAYWLSKIAHNRNDTQLADLGWKVVRLWETDVLRDPEGAANGILRLMIS